MKNITSTHWPGKAIIGLALVLGLVFSSRSEAKAPIGVSFQVFYDALTPYGDWVKDARLGYIWLPAVYDDFHPYGTNGHWVMSEYGNTWVSDYDWGWATFHYGRWYFDDYYQSWAWVPGYEWAPAWVNWRTGGGYYGWAPLGPGVSINVRVNIPSFHWVFIPQARIYHAYPGTYYAPYASKVKIINKTKVINNTVVYNNYNFYGGPSHREVQQVTRRSVPVYNIRSANAPGRMAVSRNEVQVYRPDLNQSRGRTTEAKPSRIMDSNQAREARSSRQMTPANRGNASQPSRSSNEQYGSPSRTQAPSGRSVAPSSKNSGFETKPAPSNGGRTNAPARISQPQSSRQGQANTPQPSRENQMRSQPQSAQRGAVRDRSSTPARESQVRTQPQQRTQSQPQVRTQPQQRTQSQPQVRTQPQQRTQSQPQVKNSQSSRTQSGRPEVKSSAPSRSSNTSSTRGNSSRGNN